MKSTNNKIRLLIFKMISQVYIPVIKLKRSSDTNQKESTIKRDGNHSQKNAKKKTLEEIKFILMIKTDKGLHNLILKAINNLFSARTIQTYKQFYKKEKIWL